MFKDCERCGNKFYTKKCRFTRSRFCSWQCRKTTVKKNCLACGKEFLISESRNYRKFCGHKCSHDYNAPFLSASRMRDGNPGWKGGLQSLTDMLRNSRKYAIWKTRVRRRDKRVCNNCGSNMDTHSHHIKSIGYILREHNIKTLEDAFFCPALWDVNNGQTLCFICHKQTNTYAIRMSQISS